MEANIVIPLQRRQESGLLVPQQQLSEVTFGRDSSSHKPQGSKKENNGSLSLGKMQANRQEIKYLITEDIADRVRDEVLSTGVLERDPFTEKYHRIREEMIKKNPSCNEPERGYPVFSLYLDSPDLYTFWQTEQGDRNRFKVRIRFYDNKPNSPAFLEVKRRREVVISKTRAMVSKESVNRFLRKVMTPVGGNKFCVDKFVPITRYDLPQESDLLVKPEKVGVEAYKSHIEGLDFFCNLCCQIQARPAGYTLYEREGFETPDGNEQRITLDRNLHTCALTNELTTGDKKYWKRVEMGWDGSRSLVLELKFTNRAPSHMLALVERLGLSYSSFQKYGGVMKKKDVNLSHLSPEFCHLSD